LVIRWRWAVIYEFVRGLLAGRASGTIDSFALFTIAVFDISVFVIDWRKAGVYELVRGLLAVGVVKVIGPVGWGRISAPVAGHDTSVRCRRRRQQAAGFSVIR
jgi:hypothetical protein